MKTIKLLLLFLLCIRLSATAQTEGKFSKIEILEDLSYLYTSLKNAHYDVFAYVSEEEFDSLYHSVQMSIDKDSFDLLEVTNRFQQLISGVKNGHTEIDFPVASYRNYAYQAGTLFPLEIAIEEDRCLIRKNFANENDIPIGSEILSINGQTMDEVLAKIYPQISAERTYLKNAKIELYSFPRLYWQLFGQQDLFEVSIKVEEDVYEKSLDAVSLIEGFEMKRTDVMNAQMTLKFMNTAAYLNPGDFGGDEDTYQHFIDSIFLKINENKSENLIIDLRNNRGGDNAFSDYLVSYIADKPFKWTSGLSLKSSKFLKKHTRLHSDTTNVYFQEILSRKDGEKYDYSFEQSQAQSETKRFKGQVYVLINRQSHSQSAVTAAQIQDYKFGTIVGEETGDYPSLYASQFQYDLPNSGITVKVAKGFIMRVSGSTKLLGVIPDIFIKDHLLDENDEILEGLLEILQK